MTSYYKTVTVDHTKVAGDLTGFPVLVNLASDSDLAARCQADGSDIYVTSADGLTALPHEIEHFDVSTGELQLWFKGDLSAAVDTVFRLYYGDLTHADSQDPLNVWDASYQAVYHMRLPSRAFAQNGTSQPIHPHIISPQAYYYNGKTYVVWQGGTSGALDPYISAYDHSSGTWATPVKVGTNPLSGDDHGAPAVIVDDSGYVHVFYGSHLTALKYAKSTNPEDISAWTAQADIGTNTSYRGLVKDSGGTLHLIDRAGGAWGVYNVEHRTSADAFATPVTIIAPDQDTDVPYYGNLAYDATNNRIHIAWCYWDASASTYLNIYHAYLDLDDGHLYTMAGTDLGTSISYAEYTDCLVVNSGANFTWLPALHLDGSGNPHIIYPIQTVTGYKFQYSYWTGAAWAAPEDIVSTTGVFQSLADFYFNGTAIEAYLVTEAQDPTYGRGGNLEHWRRSGGSWALVRTVMDKGAPDAIWDSSGNPHVVTNGVDGLRVVFSDLNVVDFSFGALEIFAIDSNDKYVGAGLSRTGKPYAIDSTGQRLGLATLTASGTTGQISGGVEFNGSSDYEGLIVYGSPAFPGETNWSIEAWAKPDTINSTGHAVYSQGNGSSATPMVWCFLRSFDASDGLGAIKRAVFQHTGDDGKYWYACGRTALNTGTWYHLVWVYSAAKTLALYVNGQLETLTVVNNTLSGGATLNRAAIGCLWRTTRDHWYDGHLDEVRVSTGARSAEYVETSYNNQSSPASFYTLGVEREVSEGYQPRPGAVMLGGFAMA